MLVDSREWRRLREEIEALRAEIALRHQFHTAYRAGLKRAAEIARDTHHPTLGEEPSGPPRERFYLTHIREAWEQCAHRIADAIAREAEEEE